MCASPSALLKVLTSVLTFWRSLLIQRQLGKKCFTQGHKHWLDIDFYIIQRDRGRNKYGRTGKHRG